jgi:CheY-like chemotaxis protein
MTNPPVFIIDDDVEELELIEEIWEELKFKNKLEVFSDTDNFFERLQQGNVNPFIIISDVNLPKIDGFALREKLAEQDSLRYKSIPFVFWSTSASNEQIKKAYDSGGHGFFFKGANYNEIKDSLNIIMVYWKASKAPTVPGTNSGKLS